MYVLCPENLSDIIEAKIIAFYKHRQMMPMASFEQ